MGSGPTKADVFVRHLKPLQGALEAYCRRLVRDPNSVWDVLQSAVTNAFADFHLYVEGTNFRAWIFRYLNLEILNWNRTYERTRSVELPADLSVDETWQLILDEPLFRVLLDDPELILDECSEELAGAVHSLPMLERSAFLLKTIGEFKYREIADILQVPIGTVMSMLARSRVRLRQRLLRFGEAHGLLKPETPHSDRGGDS